VLFALKLALLESAPIIAARGFRKFFPRRQQIQAGAAETKNILVIRLDNIGDVVMSTPIFRELKRQCPNVRVTVVVKEHCRELLATNPFVDEVVTVGTDLSRGLYRLVSALRLYEKVLRKTFFDMVLHPRAGEDVVNESLLVALIDAPVSIGFQMRCKSRYGFDRTQVLTRALPPPLPKSEALANADIVTALTGVQFSPITELFLTNEDCDFAKDTVASFPCVAQLIGLGFGAYRRRRSWPPNLWAKALDLLARRYRIGVLIFSSREDAAEAEDIRLSATEPMPMQIVAGASLRQVAACIGRCTLFLGTDSGLAHIAAAMRVPIVIVSPHPKAGDRMHENSPIRYAPTGSQILRILSPIKARPPCSNGCDMNVPHCILEVTPYDVLAATEEILALLGEGERENEGRP
jgi:heptosyltransferase-2